MTETLETPNARNAPTYSSMSHLLQRHRSNLYEYSKEFHKTKTNLLTKREHSELLNSIHNDIHSYRNNTGQNEHDYFLTERGRMDNANSMADEVLLNALEAQDDLNKQRSDLFGARGRVAKVLARFPQVNTLLAKIGSKKARDNWILGGTIGSLSCLLLWYIFG